jgi:hypothetical protein
VDVAAKNFQALLASNIPMPKPKKIWADFSEKVFLSEFGPVFLLTLKSYPRVRVSNLSITGNVIKFSDAD